MNARAAVVAERVSQGVIAVVAVWVITDVATGFDHRFGTWIDYNLYRDATVRWLSGGYFYQQYQLVAPYLLFTSPQPILYPPVALWLFVPFAFLPAVLWWLLPTAAVGWSLRRLRPAWWAWVALVPCVLWPVTAEEFINGNPVMWVWAFAFVAAVLAWPGPLVLMKPTLAPFALIGARSRGWWLMLALGLIASLPFAGMWGDYLRAAANLRAPWLYFVRDIPMLLMPVITAVASQRRSGRLPCRSPLGRLERVRRGGLRPTD